MSATPDPAAPAPRPAAEADDAHRPRPVDPAEQSVAGEEDPGASLDLPAGSSHALPGGAAGGHARDGAKDAGRDRGPGR